MERKEKSLWSQTEMSGWCEEKLNRGGNSEWNNGRGAAVELRWTRMGCSRAGRASAGLHTTATALDRLNGPARLHITTTVGLGGPKGPSGSTLRCDALLPKTLQNEFCILFRGTYFRLRSLELPDTDGRQEAGEEKFAAHL